MPFFSISGSTSSRCSSALAPPRPRPVRAGEASRALHRLHGRDRRRRPSPRRRPGRRPRRARADAEPAPRRDGRVRAEGQHHPDRRDEPARHPRPGAAASLAASTGRSSSTGPTARRRAILEVHSKGKPLAPEIDLDTLAAGTPGFTGADLANLINEAALLARRGKKMIEQEELEEGIMRVIAGPEKKTRIFTEEERRITAYHELGHAIVGHYLDQDSEVHKISIIGRGQALGYTISLPRGPLPDDEEEPDGEPRDDARGPRRRGDRLQRGHHRRRERPREGHHHREADGDALRDVREARPAHARTQPRHAVPRPRDGQRARLLRGDRPRDRRGDPPHHRGGACDGSSCSASTAASCTRSR